MKWIKLDNAKSAFIKKKLKDTYPKTGSSDLTFESFLSENEYELVLMNDFEDRIFCWVQIATDNNNSRTAVNMSFVIFDKAPVIKSLILLREYLETEFDEILVFTTQGSIADKIINKINNIVQKKWFSPQLENVIVYKYKKEV